MPSLELGGLGCCGVKEIRNLRDFSSAKQAFLAFADLTYCRVATSYAEEDPATRRLIARRMQQPWSRFCFVVFTQAQQKPVYGRAFANFITRHRLGSTVSTKFEMNPNSGNMVKTWVWTVDHDACRALLAKWGKELVAEKPYVPPIPE